MSQIFDDGKEVIIAALAAKCLENPSLGSLCAEFVRQFFSTVSYDDLTEWNFDDLYGAAIHFWSLIEKREPHETKIRILNPDFEQHGWQTTHTVVEIICDDMSFLVDSLRMVVKRMGLALHLVVHMGGIHIQRDANNEISAILPRNADTIDNSAIEAPVWMEIDRQTDPDTLKELQQKLYATIKETRSVVDDWSTMCSKVGALIKELAHPPQKLDKQEVEESKAFLKWLEDHHFTFLGMRDYELVQKNGDTVLQAIPNTGLGVLREELSYPHSLNINEMTPEARELTLSSHILVISKTNTLANVHRDAYTDYIGVKRFNDAGEVIGERRILGLYTSAAYNTNPKHIPFLRHKVALILENSKLNPRSHAGRVLMNILETLPRDDLIQATEAELLNIAMGIFYMQERSRIRLFARLDMYHRFVSCLVYVPKDRFNTDLRQAMQDALSDYFDATDITFSTFFSESVLARIHFMIRINPQANHNYDMKAIEKTLVEIGRSWTDDLQEFLIESCGEEKANHIFARYKHAFPTVYTASFTPRNAVIDIKHIEDLSSDNPLGMNFYQLLDEGADHYRLKIYQHDATLPLSDVLPIVENLGLRAISERPYLLKFEDGKSTWVNEFFMHYAQGNELNLEESKELFQQAFINVWFGKAENDGFNQLILAASLSWRQVSVLRAYAKYLKQVGFVFSQEYIEKALSNHPVLAKKLVQLFESKFYPDNADDRDVRFQALTEDLIFDLEKVNNLDEDKIIRQFISIIKATLRTNYYQLDAAGKPKEFISLKLNSKLIPGVPRPHPMYEIFVYSPNFEAVHLRCSKVARGGLRWSDRREDFRTEILGLMKAQQVKNSIIVPNGAKGGFVVKRTPAATATREEILAEGISCYQQFMRGLLDITDNYQGSNIIKPANVVCYDEDDPYLVVAADKGTATFSDIANAISLEYGFWLGDAFASGGSIGYDHKKMGITARGAWESVKSHFYTLNIDPETTDFTVVGIGDLAGDVFGNGMLLSKHIKLVAAFNHLHIFIDPTPNAASSFKERERMFNLPRSNWTDYNPKLISAGGGVFNRSAKSIPVSEQMKACFGITSDIIEPNELIKLLLTSEVDLLWSGGIGTFVKAETETNQEVGDRSNDLIRVNANQLRCKAVGEGGNLGLTQLARVEYAINGGLIYTDFIDNSGGVSCSDKEVNIKILLNTIVASGDLTAKQRNELLSEMTNEVAGLVLRENYLQTHAISLFARFAKNSVELHSRYLQDLVRTGKIDRALEFLPEEKTLLERKLLNQGLSSPEIAVLACYSKNILKEAILASDVPDDSYLETLLIEYFPKPLQVPYTQAMKQHPLKREIIATKISNLIVNEMGFSFVYRLHDETGATVAAIVRAYMISRSLLNMDSVWKSLEALEHVVDMQHYSQMSMMYVRLLRRLSRWFLRHHRSRLDIGKTVQQYQAEFNELNTILPDTLGAGFRAQYDEHYEEYIKLNVPKHVAQKLTTTRGMFAAMDIVQIAQQLKIDVALASSAYFAVGEFLDLGWLRLQIIAHLTENHWEALSREALQDDLDWQQRQFTLGIFTAYPVDGDVSESLAKWKKNHHLLFERWNQMLADLRSGAVLTYTMFFVIIRELLVLTQTTIVDEERK
jgi:glutamate dehydrogenase